jgi:NAD(P)-dependent dehydrogenase (short-subunit alcohol dehydrogenase family)
MALPVACDATDAEEVEATVERGVGEFGHIDVLVANARSVPEGFAMPEKLPTELFEQPVNVNLTGTWNTCPATGPRRRARPPPPAWCTPRDRPRRCGIAA